MKEYDLSHESVRLPLEDVTRFEHGLRSKNKLFLDWRLTDGCVLGGDSRACLSAFFSLTLLSMNDWPGSREVDVTRPLEQGWYTCHTVPDAPARKELPLAQQIIVHAVKHCTRF